MQNTNFLDNQFQAGAGNQDKAMAGTLEEVALSANKRLALKMSLSFHLSWDSENWGELSRCLVLLAPFFPEPHSR